jgi:hypothetical protein
LSSFLSFHFLSSNACLISFLPVVFLPVLIPVFRNALALIPDVSECLVADLFLACYWSLGDFLSVNSSIRIPLR